MQLRAVRCWIQFLTLLFLTDCTAFSFPPQVPALPQHIRSPHPGAVATIARIPQAGPSVRTTIPLRHALVRQCGSGVGCRAQAANSDMDEAYTSVDTPTGKVELSSDESWFYQTKESLHISRKIFHCTGGVIMAGFRVALSQETFLFYFGWLLTLTFITEFLRLNNFRPVRKIVHKVFHSLMRESEKNRFTTTSYYQLGVVIVSAFFSLPVAILGIMTLAVGDPIASFAGRSANMFLPEGPVRSVLCHKPYGSKSVAGTATFIVATFLTNSAVLLWLTAKGLIEAMSHGAIAAMALAAAVAGSLAELWSNEKWVLNWKRLPLAMDDNLLIPVAASLAASIVAGAALPML